MRLICPNCSTQYEVDADVIPPGGRDVQCSNCGKTWIQAGWDTAFDLDQEQENSAFSVLSAAGGYPGSAPESVGAQGDADIDADFDVTGEEAVVATELPAKGGTRSRKEARADKPAAEAPPALDVEAEPQRRVLDNSVVNILREEAEREARARKAEIETFNAGMDANLAPGTMADWVTKPDETDAPEPTVSGEPAVPNGPTVANGPTARGLRALPDIDQIDSTLRQVADTPPVDTVAAKVAIAHRRRLGFRRGFSMTLVASIILIALYVASPQITARFPAAEPALSAFVTTVDRGRIWIDEEFRIGTERLQNATDGATNQAD